MAPSTRDAPSLFVEAQRLSTTGQAHEAAHLYRAAIAIDPRFLPAVFALGQTQQAVGDLAGAHHSFSRAFVLARADAAAMRSVAPALAGVLASVVVTRYDRALEAELAACLEQAAVDAQQLALPLAQMLLAKYPTIIDDPTPIATDPLWATFLIRCLNVDAAMERVLTTVRRTRALDGTVDHRTARILAPLAIQAFAGEYVWPRSPEELALDLDALHPLLAALYRPLADASDQVAARAVKKDRLSGLLVRRTLDEPVLERRLAADMPGLSAADIDPTSAAVQAQYEANPYPRWLAPPRPRAESLAEAVRALTGVSPAPADDHPLAVLVAGCGTGYETVGLALTDCDASITAIDLSRASLAHARRMANEVGVDTVRFIHADLLDIAQLGETFDLIYATGVLHHMAVPADGLAALAGVLRAGGAIRLGLYSRRARGPIRIARDLIAARGWAPTQGGIAAFRAYVMAVPDDDPLATLRHGPDFFTISGCRDLVFHVQEHQIDLHEMLAMIRASGLEPTVIEAPADVLAQFRRTFGADADIGDFGMWDQLEAHDPTIFAAMYLIWAVKR